MSVTDGATALFSAAAASYAMAPPEITSELLYSGPGAGPMLAAVTAWESLAAELHSASSSYHATLANLTNAGWTGPSSAMMTAAVTPFVTWLSSTAAQANHTAVQLRAAAGAYQAAIAAAVPPAAVVANRTQLATLLATNVFGVNTAKIAAVEAQYQQMWAQDAVVMHGYSAAAAAATRVSPFAKPPRTSNNSRANSTEAGDQSALGSFIQQVLSLHDSSFAIADDTGKGGLMANDTMGAINMGMVQLKTFFKPLSALPPIPKSDLGAGLSGIGGLSSAKSGLPGLPGTMVRAVSADVSGAPRIGSLSVPPSWGTATPAIRLAVNEIPAASAPAALAAPAAGAPQGLSGLGALGSLGAGAIGGSAPAAIKGATFRTGGAGSRGPAKGKAPVQLDRVIAHLQKRRDAVQHWQVDQAGLDDLLDELSKKPGFHAVHVSRRGATASASTKVQ